MPTADLKSKKGSRLKNRRDTRDISKDAGIQLVPSQNNNILNQHHMVSILGEFTIPENSRLYVTNLQNTETRWRHNHYYRSYIANVPARSVASCACVFLSHCFLTNSEKQPANRKGSQIRGWYLLGTCTLWIIMTYRYTESTKEGTEHFKSLSRKQRVTT